METENNKAIKYSLVIGTYNPRPEWLKNALKSAEGLFDEIIIIDDNSDVPVPNSSLRHDANLGFFEARNSGCRLANGEWIISLDDDDEFIRENVIALQNVIDLLDADIVHAPCELFGTQTGYWGANPDWSKILEYNQIPSGSWFKKSVCEKLQGFKFRAGEDWDFWARARKHGFKFVEFMKPIYRHRMHNESLSHSWVGDKFIEIRNNVRKSYEEERI